MRSIGWIPDEPIIVTQLEPKMTAAKAGMRVGDQITAINGTPVRSLMAVTRPLQNNGDKPVEITALRNRQELKFTTTPVMTEDNGQKRYRLGFQSDPVTVTKLPFATALAKSIDQNKKYSFLIVDRGCCG